MSNKCTKPNCHCAEYEMNRQGTEFIKNYPCLGIKLDADQLKSQPSVEAGRTHQNTTDLADSFEYALDTITDWKESFKAQQKRFSRIYLKQQARIEELEKQLAECRGETKTGA